MILLPGIETSHNIQDMTNFLRKSILATLLAGCVAGMNAAEAALSIELKDGKSATWLLNKKPVITFDADRILITAETVSTAYDRSEVAGLTFTEQNTEGARDVISDSDAVYSYTGNIFSCPGSDITVFSVSGNSMVSGRDEVSLGNLPSGIYIVSAAGQSFKVIKK